MSAIRKVVMSAATLFLALSGMFMAVGAATAAPVESRPFALDCDDDWHSPCP